MQPIYHLGRASGGLLDRLLCILGAVLFSQAPEFMQQYLQRLGGHLDEARRQLDRLAATASQSGLSLDELRAHAAASPDPAVARLGDVVRDTAARVDLLAAAEAALRHASLASRPWVFLRNYDSTIAGPTWAAFRPAVPTTLEGASYALVGMAVALGLYHLGVKTPVRRAWEARQARRVRATAPRV